MGRFRPVWGVGRRGERGDPPGRGMRAPPDPKSPPKTGGKPRPSGGFTDSAAFPPKPVCADRVYLWGGSRGCFLQPRRPCPRQRSLREPDWGKKTPKTGSAGTVGSQKLVFVPLSPQNGPFQGWKGRGSFGFGHFSPIPKLLKLPENALLAGPAPKLGILTKNQGFFTPEKVLSQRLRTVPGEGEELLNRFPQIFPQSEGMERSRFGDGGGLGVVSLPSPQ